MKARRNIMAAAVNRTIDRQATSVRPGRCAQRRRGSEAGSFVVRLRRGVLVCIRFRIRITAGLQRNIFEGKKKGFITTDSKQAFAPITPC